MKLKMKMSKFTHIGYSIDYILMTNLQDGGVVDNDFSFSQSFENYEDFRVAALNFLYPFWKYNENDDYIIIPSPFKDGYTIMITDPVTQEEVSCWTVLLHKDYQEDISLFDIL